MSIAPLTKRYCKISGTKRVDVRVDQRSNAKARAFVPCKPFELSPMFSSNTGAYPVNTFYFN
jgi:hypothetical protein